MRPTKVGGVDDSGLQRALFRAIGGLRLKAMPVDCYGGGSRLPSYDCVLRLEGIAVDGGAAGVVVVD